LTGDLAMRFSESLFARLRQSPFLPALCACETSIEVQLGSSTMMVHFERSRLRMAVPADRERAHLHLTLTDEYFATGSTTGVTILHSGSSHSSVHPTVERLVIRTLEGGGPRNDAEVAELAYGPYFGFADPRQLWCSSGGTVKLLAFDWRERDCAAVVSCGLASVVPELLPSPRQPWPAARRSPSYLRYVVGRFGSAGQLGPIDPFDVASRVVDRLPGQAELQSEVARLMDRPPSRGETRLE
jgi:hypothetical protein